MPGDRGQETMARETVGQESVDQEIMGWDPEV